MQHSSPSRGHAFDAYLRAQQPRTATVDASETVVPPVLYLPVRELPDGGLVAQVHETTDRRQAILVFTALDRLLDACGRNQPWKLIETSALDVIQETQPFDIVAFDPELPSELLAGGRLA